MLNIDSSRPCIKSKDSRLNLLQAHHIPTTRWRHRKRCEADIWQTKQTFVKCKPCLACLRWPEMQPSSRPQTRSVAFKSQSAWIRRGNQRGLKTLVEFSVGLSSFPIWQGNHGQVMWSESISCHLMWNRFRWNSRLKPSGWRIVALLVTV